MHYLIAKIVGPVLFGRIWCGWACWTAMVWTCYRSGAAMDGCRGVGAGLRDNRAFCNYVCPVAVPLKIASAFSLVRVAGDTSRCDACERCTRLCPMDIRVSDYIRQGQRVLSTECTGCQTCISACPRQALKLKIGLDLGGKDLLRHRGEAV
jgi:ferredoxin